MSLRDGKAVAFGSEVGLSCVLETLVHTLPTLSSTKPWPPSCVVPLKAPGMVRLKVKMVITLLSGPLVTLHEKVMGVLLIQGEWWQQGCRGQKNTFQWGGVSHRREKMCFIWHVCGLRLCLSTFSVCFGFFSWN